MDVGESVQEPSKDIVESTVDWKSSRVKFKRVQGRARGDRVGTLFAILSEVVKSSFIMDAAWLGTDARGHPKISPSSPIIGLMSVSR